MLLYIATFLSLIFGTVTNQSGEPVSGAQITVNQKTVFSDSLGHFSVDDTLPASVKVRSVGYKDQTLWTNKERLKIVLIADTSTLEEVVINSVRASELAPITQTTISKKDIEQNYFGQEMPFILQKTPSIISYSDAGSYSGYSYFRLRGIDQTRINVTLNGVPLNEPEDQGVYFCNFSDFGNSIQSAQIQRGVSTSSFGTASYGGSINFESINLTRTKPGAELQTSYGSYNSYRISPEVYSGMKNGWSFYSRYSHSKSDGFRYNSFNESNSLFFSGGYFGKKDVVKLTAFSGRAKNGMAYLATSESDLKQDLRTNYLSSDEKDDFGQEMTQLQWTREINNNWTNNTSVFYNHLKGDYDVKFDSASIYNFALESNFAGLINTVKYEKDGINFQLGANANTYSRTHNMSQKPFGSVLFYNNKGVKNEGAVFVKSSRSLNKLTIYSDVQFRIVNFTYHPEKSYQTSNKSISWNFWNPKVGFTYQFTPYLNAYASYGRTQREPTRTDMFAGYDDMDTSNQKEIGDLTRVKPEKVNDYEVGIRLNKNKIITQLNFYAMEFKNEIAAIGQLSYIGLPLRKNVESSFRRGVELDFSYNPIKNIRFTQNATLSYNRIKSYTTDFDSIEYKNRVPLLTPSFISNTSLDWTHKFLSVGINARYLSSSYLDNTNTLKVPGAEVFSGNVGLRINKNIKCNFIVNNIFNKTYYTSGYVQAGSPYYFAQTKRNYFVTLNYIF